MDKYNYLPIENEGRLRNYDIRDNFFTKIFLLNNLKNTNNIRKFHNKNLLLLKSYNEELTDKLSELLDKEEIENISDYQEKILNIVSNKRNKSNKISVTISLFEKYKPMLNTKEIDMFYGLVNSYNNQKIPFSALMVAIKMYATRFDDNDILNQTFFYPYPENLINITDSGKGRKL